jgi:hypothetical protein
MKEWFDHCLMDKPAPKWIEEGIPLPQMKDHLEERTTEMNKPATAPPANSTSGGGGEVDLLQGFGLRHRPLADHRLITEQAEGRLKVIGSVGIRPIDFQNPQTAAEDADSLPLIAVIPVAYHRNVTA